MHDWYMLEMTNFLTTLKSETRREKPFLPMQRQISNGDRLGAYRSTFCQSLCGAISAPDQKHRQAMCHGIRCCTVSGTCEPETANSPRRLDGGRKYGRWSALHAIISLSLRTCRGIRWLYMLLLEKVLVVRFQYPVIPSNLDCW